MPFLEIRHLSKSFPLRGKALFRRQRKETLAAVSDVTITLAKGSVLGLVGESGSGKTTIARCILRLERPSTGEIFVEGARVDALSDREDRAYRSKVQMVFQDSYGSLDPRQAVFDIVEEPLRLLTDLDPSKRREQVEAMLADVGLPLGVAGRYRHELSGGQQQRVN